MRLALRQSIAIEQRRLDYLARMETSLRTASIRLQTLERATASLHSQGHALGLGPGLLEEVDALCRDVGTDSIEDPTSPEVARAVLGATRSTPT